MSQANASALGARSPNQQGSDQSGAGGVGDRIDLGRHTAGLVQHLPNQRQHAFDVITAGKLRHHAAIGAMQVDLTEQRIGQKPAFTVVKCDTPVSSQEVSSPSTSMGLRLVEAEFEGAHNSRHSPSRLAVFDQRLCIPGNEGLTSATLKNRRPQPRIFCDENVDSR
jgi:hypothetical protein